MSEEGKHKPLARAVALAVSLESWEPELLRQWSRAAGTRPHCHLRPLLPLLLRRLREHIMTVSTGYRLQPLQPEAESAFHRLAEAIELSTCLPELILLRSTVLTQWEAQQGTPAEDRRLLERSLDEMLLEFVAAHEAAQKRIFAAFDRIASVALQDCPLDESLSRLLFIVVETATTVDTAAFFLVEGDHLSLRAVAGLRREEVGHLTLQIGEGFAGRVAAQHDPAFLSAAGNSPEVRSAGLRTYGVQALYGIPLLLDGRLLGVATMGSRQDASFSRVTEQLLRALGERAAEVIAFKSQQEERARLLRELEAARTELEDLVRMLSHDVRTPLYSALVQADLIADATREGLPAGGPATWAETTSRAAAAIKTSVERVSNMVDELANMIQADVGQLPLEKRPINLGKFLTEMLHRLAGTGGMERVRLDFDPELPLISADPAHLERILSNLLTNALKFSPPDRDVLLQAKREPAGVIIAVMDQGPGIRPEDLPRIFERYFRASQNGGVTGLGLGLHIARMLANAQRARIEVTSELGRGSTFRVVFPPT